LSPNGTNFIVIPPLNLPVSTHLLRVLNFMNIK